MSPHLSLSALRTPLLALCSLLPVAAFAQGALTPPGAPAPTMKSLTELDASLTALAAKAETRIAIDALPGDATAQHVINAPGSYFLRANLVAGSSALPAIRVTADGVVIDLNGFAIIGGANSTAANINAIAAGSGALQRLVVRNGTITGWFTGIGSAQGLLAADLVIENCTRSGAELGIDSIARNIAVRNVGYIGISAGSIESCRVKTVGGYGANATGLSGNIVRGCEVTGVFASGGNYAYGIQAPVVSDCRVTGISSASYAWGIDGFSGTSNTVDHCAVENVTSSGTTANAYGIRAGNASNCNVYSIGGSPLVATGISATVAADCTVSTVSTTYASGYIYGIYTSTARDCRVSSLAGAGTNATGISGSNVINCSVSGVQPTAGSGTGIGILTAGIVRGNFVTAIRDTGIDVSGSGALVTENSVGNVGTGAGITTGAGILVQAQFCRIENNLLTGGTGSDYGIRVTSNLSFIVGNRSSATFSGAATGAGGVDTPEFNISSGNRFGPIVNTFAATGEITATNPFANFRN